MMSAAGEVERQERPFFGILYQRQNGWSSDARVVM
jgi:hypothetical protein